MKPLILVEFNELTPRLLDRWMGEGLLPNFKRLYEQSVVYTTVSDETEPVNLEPWIQWYSVHTGLPFREHGVFHLTDGSRAEHVDIWRHLHAHGRRVWNCSSMNTRGFDFDGSCYLPDPWCTSEAPFPAELAVFHRFVGQQVREYSKGDTLSIGDATAFLSYMLTHGLSWDTVKLTARQLLQERLVDRHLKWRRVAIQDRLQLDVFEHHYRRIKPHFATFFANSTAHLQHSYWRHMEPEQFVVQPSKEELQRYSGAIEYGYRMMDQVLGRIMRLAAPHGRVVLATALSQQPYLKYEHVGGHRFYRPIKIEQLLQRLSIRYLDVQPVMTHQFLARFENQQACEDARARLESLRLGDQSVFGFDDSEPGSLYFGCQLRGQLDPQASLVSPYLSPDPVPFGDIFYQLEGMKSGRHHPEGCLWIQSDRGRRHDEKVSILDIFPTVCGLLGVPAERWSGRALEV